MSEHFYPVPGYDKLGLLAVFHDEAVFSMKPGTELFDMIQIQDGIAVASEKRTRIEMLFKVIQGIDPVKCITFYLCMNKNFLVVVTAKNNITRI